MGADLLPWGVRFGAASRDGMGAVAVGWIKGVKRRFLAYPIPVMLARGPAPELASVSGPARAGQIAGLLSLVQQYIT